MNLYLLRHGPAEGHHPGGDAGRRLTSEGSLIIGAVADGLRRRAISFDRIIASPYARAMETARIVSDGTGYEREIFTDERLIPSGQFERVSDLIRECSDATSVLLVGHQPLIGDAASRLTSEGHLKLAVTPGTMVAVEVAGFRPYAHGVLLWSAPPEQIG